MPGKDDEVEVENQEPTNQEIQSEEIEEAPKRYEDLVIDAITGVMGLDEE